MYGFDVGGFNQVTGTNSLGHTFGVRKASNVNQLQKLLSSNATTVPEDLSTPEGRMLARMNATLPNYMDTMLADGGALDWTIDIPE